MYVLYVDLHKCIEESYSPKPLVRLTTTMYDVKGWLQGVIAEVHRHTHPLCFKFDIDEDGKVVMYSRHWTTDPWKQDGHLLLVSIY